MATNLKEAMKAMEGVGQKEQVKLANFLETSHVKNAQTMDKILYSKDGFVATGEKMKESLSSHGKKMIDEITALMKDSAGKNAKDTRDILIKMRAVSETLKDAGGGEAKDIKKFMEKGLAELEKRGTRRAILGDLIKGRISGIKDKMIRGVPLIGGLAGDYLQERKRRNLIKAETKERIGKFVDDDEGGTPDAERTPTEKPKLRLVGSNEDGTSKFEPVETGIANNDAERTPTEKPKLRLVGSKEDIKESKGQIEELQREVEINQLKIDDLLSKIKDKDVVSGNLLKNESIEKRLVGSNEDGTSKFEPVETGIANNDAERTPTEKPKLRLVGSNEDGTSKFEPVETGIANNDAERTADATEKILENTTVSRKHDERETKEAKGGKLEDKEAANEKKKGLKAKLKGMFGVNRRGEGGSRIGGEIIGSVLGSVVGMLSGSVIGKFLTGTLLPALGSVMSSIVGVALPAVMIAVAAYGGYMAGGYIFEKWVGPWMDKKAKQYEDEENKGKTFEQKATLIEGTDEQAIEITTEDGKTKIVAKSDAVKMAGGEKEFQAKIDSGEYNARTYSAEKETGLSVAGRSTINIEDEVQRQKDRDTSTKIRSGEYRYDGTGAQREATKEEQELEGKHKEKFALINALNNLHRLQVDMLQLAGEFKKEDGKFDYSRINLYNSQANRLRSQYASTYKSAFNHPEISEDSIDVLEGMLDTSYFSNDDWSHYMMPQAFGGLKDNLKNIETASYNTSKFGSWWGKINTGQVETYKEKLSFREGGIGDFGEGTPAMLHGKEAIIPLNDAMTNPSGTKLTPQGAGLAYAMSTNAVMQGTPTNQNVSGGANIVAMNSPTVVNNTDNIFTGDWKTRNQEPTYRETLRRTYA